MPEDWEGLDDAENSDIMIKVDTTIETEGLIEGSWDGVALSPLCPTVRNLCLETTCSLIRFPALQEKMIAIEMLRLSRVVIMGTVLGTCSPLAS